MDDGSGNRFGRLLLRGYFFNKMPIELAAEFEEEYNLDADYVKANLYKEPNPNAYLATFAKFIIKHKENYKYNPVYFFIRIKIFVALPLP